MSVKKLRRKLALSINVYAVECPHGSINVEVGGFIVDRGTFGGEGGELLETILYRIDKFARTELSLGSKESSELT